ncbi:MAG: type II CAAX endopeptidase family protein [Desulfobacterales bacterium]
METNRRLLKAFLLATLGIALLEILFSRAGGRLRAPSLLLTGFARAAEACWIFTSLFLLGLGRGEIFLPEGGLCRGLRRGLLWSAVFGALSLAAFAALWWGGRDPLRLFGIGRPPSAPPWLYLAVGCGVGPLVEEIYFRGLLYRVVRPQGRILAVGGTTILFALLHAGAGGFPVVPLIGGLIFATAVEVEKNLLVPITIHVLGNTALFALPHLASKFQL